MSASRADGALEELAGHFGVETGYRGVDGLWHRADPDAVLHVLAALGAPVAGRQDVDAALAEARDARATTVLEPVVALHDGATLVTSSLPPGSDPSICTVQLTTEDGAVHRLRAASGARARKDGRVEVAWDLAPADMDAGYHRLELTCGDLTANSLVLVAPHCPTPDRGWGLFAPVHALRGAADSGLGTYADLEVLADWAAQLGADFVGTLPLYPVMVDPRERGGSVDPSPYLPVTRLGWSELFLDAGPPDGDGDDAGLVDYPRVAALRRFQLAPVAERAFHRDAPERGDLDRFAAERPELVAYARFRDIVSTGEPPAGASDSAADLDSLGPTGRYHFYAQWRADAELARLAGRLYLDLPVGVHPAGFDPWWFPSSFARGVQGGAPPDAFYSKGQTWGFRPMHPIGVRTDGYRYPVACLRQVMRRASVVRIDHVMSLHRLFWVPEGTDAQHGVYVRGRLDELRAVVAIEADRSGTVVVGEDLGTVPEEVREAMADSRILRSWVMEFEVSGDDPLPPAPVSSMASVATHDLPRFAAFWDGTDIDEQAASGRLDEQEVQVRRAERAAWRVSLLPPVEPEDAGEPPAWEADPRDALAACLGALAAGPARLVLVDLEDLWLERRPVNRPGSVDTSNWSFRSRRSLDQVMSDGDVERLLRAIDGRRRGPVVSSGDQESRR